MLKAESGASVAATFHWPVSRYSGRPETSCPRSNSSATEARRPGVIKSAKCPVSIQADNCSVAAASASHGNTRRQKGTVLTYEKLSWVRLGDTKTPPGPRRSRTRRASPRPLKSRIAPAPVMVQSAIATVGNSDSNNGTHWNNTRPISKLHRGLESERRRIGDLPFGVGPENVLELGAEIDAAIDMDVVVGFQNHLVALRRGGGIADRNA
jgi:hypothetical protein